MQLNYPFTLHFSNENSQSRNPLTTFSAWGGGFGGKVGAARSSRNRDKTNKIITPIDKPGAFVINLVFYVKDDNNYLEVAFQKLSRSKCIGYC